MTTIAHHLTRSIAAAGVVAGLCAAMFLAPAGQAAGGKTQTLRFFDKVVSVQITKADGTVAEAAAVPRARPRRHARRGVAGLRRQPRQAREEGRGDESPALRLPREPRAAGLHQPRRARLLDARVRGESRDPRPRHRQVPRRRRGASCRTPPSAAATTATSSPASPSARHRRVHRHPLGYGSGRVPEHAITYGKTAVPVYRHGAAPLKGLPAIPESGVTGLPTTWSPAA